MTKKLLILFIFFSFITHPIGDYETGNAIMRRVTFSDIFGGLALLIGVSKLFKGFILSSKISKIYIAGLVLLASFFIPIVFSLNITATLVESIIVLFLIVLSILIFYSFKDDLLSKLIPILLNTVLIAAILGFYDLIADMFGLPRLFKQRSNAELISGFRNAGQAGAYFMVFIAILLPLKQSSLTTKLSKKQKIKLNITLIISIIFLFSTGKVAAWIGFIIGIGLFAVFNRKVKNIVTIGIATFLIFITYQNLDIIAPELSKRLERRIRTRIIYNLEDNKSEDTFFKKNWGGAIRAFKDRPITGTGIGGFYGNYGKYEVHSTYLKMIGETGIIGVFGYLTFIISFLFFFKKKKITYKDNPYYDYLKKMLPFVIGCLVSWSYTYHIRKREFWIMVAILVIVHYQAKLWDYNKSLKLKNK